MPELPEVETTLNGIAPHIEGTVIQDVIIRQSQLRWPIAEDLPEQLKGQRVGKLSRRGKYLLMPVGSGTVMIHLGMSGHLRIVPRDTPYTRHSHVDILFATNQVLRYTDPRRFGCILWTTDSPLTHKLLKKLGPEPLSAQFSATYLHQSIQQRQSAIKVLIMNAHVVVGVGNIYATEALFMANIHPQTPGKKISLAACNRLVDAIKRVLATAISQGGTTLKDFKNSDGKPGYFVQQLQAYGRSGLPCVHCHTPLQSIQLGQRSTTFCSRCQPLQY
ncbi:MAG: bifunctional DNA-formamidopyrimidine glycosylase/DNA-(apurinic or apyrimidinic site) lyase [Legionellaceae bacterium]|nr:bifunctional DNA-formamidopyrimidine glycosylase/DNA-(apurinic or apyrimidinic site) lyase [Legionellaceae bacterium]